LQPSIRSRCRLRNFSRIQRVNERSNNPWYRLALIFVDDFIIKKKERIRPWKTPIKINTEIASK
jgi:hypothetical protein